MENLKSCPFCKGTAELVVMKQNQRHENGFRKVGRYVQCTKCGAKSKTFKYRRYNHLVDSIAALEEQAIAAWNQRSETTCKVVERYKDELGDWVVFRCGHTDIWTPYMTTCPWCHGRLDE